MKLETLQWQLLNAPMPLFFGGSFNPFHRGHRAIVHALYRHFPSCPLTLLPNRSSPLKPAGQQGESISQKTARMQMVVQDLQLPGLRLELCELRREGPSYTADTLRHLRATPKSRCVLALGWDSLCTLEYWKDWPYLLETCILVVFRREGAGALTVPAEYVLLELDEPYSSAEIRKLLAATTAGPVALEELLGPRQFSYIQQQGLYR